MNRTNFYTIGLVDNTEELDYLYNSLSNFKTDYPVSFYRVTDTDLQRPDLISYSFYNTVDYWWIICYLNNIHNPLTELFLGQVLALPSIMDIYEFNKKYRVR